MGCSYAAEVNFRVQKGLFQMIFLELRFFVSVFVAIELQPQGDKSLFFYSQPGRRYWIIAYKGM